MKFFFAILLLHFPWTISSLRLFTPSASSAWSGEEAGHRGRRSRSADRQKVNVLNHGSSRDDFILFSLILVS